MDIFKKYILVIAFTIFIGFSYIFTYNPGIEIFNNFIRFGSKVIKFLPTIFILIGIFEIWVKRDTIEKHLGEKSKFTSYIWAIILAGTTVGGLYVALPIAKSLYDKGAKLSVVFAFLGASSVARIPMTLFEASFLGIKFTTIRLLVSIPIIILSSIIIEKIYQNKDIFIINDH